MEKLCYNIAKMNKWGIALRQERAKRGLTQEAVAKELGISQRLVSYIETGGREPGPQTQLKIAARFGLWHLVDMGLRYLLIYAQNLPLEAPGSDGEASKV